MLDRLQVDALQSTLRLAGEELHGDADRLASAVKAPLLLKIYQRSNIICISSELVMPPAIAAELGLPLVFINQWLNIYFLRSTFWDLL